MGPDKTAGDNQSNATFSIVGIGASAGGLHSFECFLEALPKDFDFAVVFIQHLSPAHKSLMPEILRSKWRDYEFIEIDDGLQLLPGRLYLCPPAIEVRIHEGAFRVISRPDEHIHFPIDEFLVSLAEDTAERAVAVIFSGAGTDGVRGIQAIRNEGGAVFVQDPATAQFPELPQAAIKTGLVDSVLPPPDIAREIVKLLESGAVTGSPDNLISPAELESFYLLIRERTGLRFNHYKKSVISRRIRRRMQLQGIASITAYLNAVADKPREASLLASDLMIGVTSFFRDRLAWKALRIEVIRKIVTEDGDTPIRVWTPACATGEESYSIAMTLRHELDLAGSKREIQVFATDVNDSALEKAREGKYPASIAADIPADYQNKFFNYTDDGLALAVSKELRQHVIFAKQDLLTDPPFSRLDLVICRNLLIYLEPDAQDKCITLFHYALSPGGYLFLGNAESPGRKSALFKSLAHKKCRVYEKIEIEPSSRLPLTVPFTAERSAISFRQQSASDQGHSIIHLSQEALLEEYGPAAVTIDQNYDILYNNGPTKRYLTQPRGALTHNLLELMPETLRNRIRGAIYKVTQEARRVSIRASLSGDEGKKRQVSISVSKIKDNLFLVVFREKAGQPLEASLESFETVRTEEPAALQLEIELSATRHELQSNIEQLKSLNEEQQSSNEELQAANEELETSREELQSLNEELITVNTQLQSKVEEQEETNNDLNNFQSSANIPTIFLDRNFRVKRFTPAITKLIKLIPSDVGRQIMDMSQEHLGPDLIADSRLVLENLVPVKKEIRINGSWYLRTALPYRTLDDRIEGVVVTYGDITENKRAEEEIRTLLTDVQQEKTKLSSLINSISDEVWFADTQGRFTIANPSALREFGISSDNIVEVEKLAKNMEVFRPDGSPRPVEEAPPLRGLAGEMIRNQEEIVRTPATGDLRYREVSTTPVRDDKGVIIGSVSIVHDITERKKAEEQIANDKYLQQLLLDHFPGVVLLLRTTTREVVASNQAGIDVGAVCGSKCFETWGQGQDPCPWCLAEDLWATGKEQHVVIEGDGKVFEAHWVPVADDLYMHYAFDITERKRAEQKLQEKEQLIQQALGVSNSFTFDWDAATDEVRRSDSCKNIFGIDSEEMCDATAALFSQHVHPDDKSRFEELLRNLTPTADTYTTQFRLVLSDGSVVTLEETAQAIFDAGGKIKRAMGVATDITKRKRAEEALLESMEQFRTLADSIPNLAWWANGDGYITWYNRRWYEYTGTTPEQMEGWGWQRVHDPEVLPQVLERWKESIATGEPFDMEFPLRGADGVFRPFLTRIMPLKDSTGRVIRWFGTNTDISELRKAEEAQGRLGAIVESADDAIISKDLNGIIQTWNIGAEKMFGYKAEEIIGRPVSLLIPPGHIDEVPEILARIKQGEHIEQFETVRMRKDGTIIPVSLTFSAVKDTSGRIIGASKIAHDITERKNAEEEIRRHAEELSVKNEELELFNRAAVGRELRMVELKKEVNKLHIQVGEPPRYDVDFEEEQP